MSSFKTYADVLKKRNELKITRAKLSKLTNIPIKTIENGETRNSALTAENSILFEVAFKIIESDNFIDSKTEKKQPTKKSSKDSYKLEEEYHKFINEEDGIYMILKERIKTLEKIVKIQDEQIDSLKEKNRDLELKSQNNPKYTSKTL